MKRSAIPAAFVCSLLLVVSGDSGAVSTRSWTTASYADFDKGEAEDALITSDGEVMPGLGKERVDLETDAIWSMDYASDGTIYAGAVADGQVFEIRNGKQKKLVSLGEDSPWMGSLVSDDKTLFAGTLGTGDVHAINRASGKATLLVHLADAEHVWALALDAGGKTLYAATGPEGKLFAIDVAKKQARVVWTAEDKHLFSLLRAKDGALWIGTADEAILYRFDPKDKKARAIADFAGTEIKAIVQAGDAFVVATNDFERQTTDSPSPPKPKGATGEKAKPPATGSKPGSEKEVPLPARKGGKKAKGALFRVETSGTVEQLHALAAGYFTSLTLTSDGDVFAGAGAQGRVYQVRPDRTVLTAFDVPERQVNTVAATREGNLVFATGDAGAVYVSTRAASKAAYTSDAFDAKGPARWGNIRWRATGDVVLETRSGNTSKPGAGWSGWQKPSHPQPSGGQARRGTVVSAPGRYLQYRVTWPKVSAASSARLREVTLYYLPQNQRARVTEVAIKDGTSDKWVTTAEGPIKPRLSTLTIDWKTENPDGDPLIYNLEYRAEGESKWRHLPTGIAPLAKTSFSWNTESLPDGHYELRVRVSDARANPSGTALTDEKTSQPFLIDNQKPRIDAVTVRDGSLAGRVSDSFSRIKEIAYSVDDGDWLMTFPKDGIFDDLTESFAFKLPTGLKAGEHILSIRAADEARNIGAKSVNFRVE